MSADSLARLTQDGGQRIGAQRTSEAPQANQPAPRGERPDQPRIPEVAAISGQAHLATDSARLLVRGEGWKEVKVVAGAAVAVQPASPRQADPASPRASDPRVALSQHSYQAGLGDADTLAPYQYAEGLRRGLARCCELSSVNDGARWIKRIPTTNFPQAQPIVDWRHAADHLWAVANAVGGEPTPQATQWTSAQLDRLCDGPVADVVSTLDKLDLQQAGWPALRRAAPDYFRFNQARMRYEVFRAQGLPIGSGTVENAANTVVHHRLKRPGRGWERDHAQAMLAALSELHSGRFEQAWQLTFSRS